MAFRGAVAGRSLAELMGYRTTATRGRQRCSGHDVPKEVERGAQGGGGRKKSGGGRQRGGGVSFTMKRVNRGQGGRECVARGAGVGRGGEPERLAMVKTNGMEPPRRKRENMKRVQGDACRS